MHSRARVLAQNACTQQQLQGVISQWLHNSCYLEFMFVSASLVHGSQGHNTLIAKEAAYWDLASIHTVKGCET